jgi:hypothetical protein
MELNELPPKNGAQRAYCDNCKGSLDLIFARFHDTVSGIEIDIDGMPMLQCSDCDFRALPDRSRFSIFLWIAFNAAYADEGEFQTIQPGERAAFTDFFGRLIALDDQRRIYGAIWQRFSGPVRLPMDNRYVFNPFWQHHDGIAGFEDWEERFKASSRAFAQVVQSGDTQRVLSFVFDRLYVLRNQLVHGGWTWNSGINRTQVRDGAAILGFLMPVFADLMMDNPDQNWGKPFYPVVP